MRTSLVALVFVVAGSSIAAPPFPFSPEAAAKHQKDTAAALGVPVEFIDSVGITFVLIPPGTFVMGSPKDEPGHGSGGYDETQHTVTISRPFYLAKHEVTVGQFRKFVEATKHVTDCEKRGGGHAHDAKAVWIHRPGTNWTKPGYAGPYEQKDDHPVVHVSHNDARAFCRWLNERAGLKAPAPADKPPAAPGAPADKADDDKPPPGALTYDLPTEAQWEWACRAGAGTRYWWGPDQDKSGRVANVGDATIKRVHQAWPRVVMPMDDGHAFTAPVGSYRANAFGLHDMLGNVWEFCSTRYGPYPTEPTTDPGDLDPKRGFAVRGGGWSNVPDDVRCASRNADPPDFGHSNLGFRVALRLRSTAK